MGRKLKYKDVVKKGPPQNFKKNKKDCTKYKSANKYKSSGISDNKKTINKKKQWRSEDKTKFQPRTQIESSPVKYLHQDELSSESEDDVPDDPMIQLRETFGTAINSNSVISESDTDSESEEEESKMDDDDSDDEDGVSESDDDGFTNSDNNLEPLANDECSEDVDKEDPFTRHVSHELHSSLLESVEQYLPESVNTTREKWPLLGDLIFQIPKTDNMHENFENQLEQIEFATPGKVPNIINKKCTSTDLFIKSQIFDNIQKANKCINRDGEIFTLLQKEMFSIINNYQDFYFPEETFDNAEEIRLVYCLHAVNHVLKTRIKILHHNAKILKKENVEEGYRDHGLVRPKVLIVVPFKHSAYLIINTIIDIMFKEDKGNVSKKIRFIEDYTGNKLSFPKKNPKPDDYEQTFRGNTSDDFKMGLTITKKSLKLYSDFYSSDIIISSPLGLRTIIGAEGEPDRDFDFLTSIELLILDQTEIFLMQNWDHIIHLFGHMHLKPKDLHGTDVSRVRQWSLNLWAKYYRQTLIFSSVNIPEINSIFNKKCFNYEGKVKTMNKIEMGCISQVFVPVPHIFHKFTTRTPLDAFEDRFQFFIKKILPQQRDSLMKQTLVYIPSYYDFVKIRNYFKKEDVNFVQICEYTKESKVARARDMFYHGDAHFLLYTERHHFFNRLRIKGIRHLIFYQPPNIPHFYHEMCNLMQEINMNKKVGSMANMTVTVIYSMYDVLQLAYIIGSEKVAKISQSDRNVHFIVTGSD